MFIIVLLFTILMIYGVTFAKNNTYFDDYLSLNNTQIMKGICSLIVLLHHISLSMKGNLYLKLFNDAGFLAVSVFFFFSGYGLMCGYERKNYLDKFLFKRIPKILFPFLIVNSIFTRVYFIMGNVHTTKDIISVFWVLSCLIIVYGMYG